MSIRFKFKSDHEYEDLELPGPSISCGDLKQAILDKRMNGSGGAFGLLLTNATTGEESEVPAEHTPTGEKAVGQLAVPFGPFLALAAIEALLFREEWSRLLANLTAIG